MVGRVRLTAIEFKLLRMLMESPGRVFTRDQLLASMHAFNEAAVVDRGNTRYSIYAMLLEWI